MKDKWYFKPYVLVIVFLCVGPLALPLVWLNPNFNRKNKIIISALIIAVTWLLGVLFVKSMKSMYEYYNLIFQDVY